MFGKGTCLKSLFNLKAMKDNLVICPVFNEEETLKEFFFDLRNNYSDDVLFVDDGSGDAGRKILNKIIGKNTFLLRHGQRLGYGATLRTGFSFARDRGYEKVVTIDVDLQHNPACLKPFLRMLDHYDVALGSRYLRIDQTLDVPRQRLLINRYIAGLFRVRFGIMFTDPFCGFRGYRRWFIFQACLEEDSYGFALEVLMEMIRLNVSFAEVPVPAIYFPWPRRFLDDLNSPRLRLLHYLEVINRKAVENEKKISYCEFASG